jgi:oligopeptide/dipeptide ABC transporter ATP-binding protein
VSEVLRVENLGRWYSRGRRLGREQSWIKSLTDVSFHIAENEIVGLIGESGCGKSTLARSLLWMEPVQFGAIWLNGKAVTKRSRRALRPYRRMVQLIWQNPVSAISSRKRIDRVIREPLDIHKVGTEADRRARVYELLDLVNLPAAVALRFPHELSGGQLQRVAIARGLAPSPKLLVCDEPTASLDVSVRAQITNLFLDIRDRLGLSILYISHDIWTVSAISDRVLVMYLGRIVEEAPAASFRAGLMRHPYSQALMASLPTVTGAHSEVAALPMGDIPSPGSIPSGCAYHPRCALARDVCATSLPELTPLGGDLGKVRCHAVNGSGHSQWLRDAELGREVIQSQ